MSGDLPRFSRGQIGRLSFSDLNSAFDTIDRVRPLLIGDAGQPNGMRETLCVARIIESDTYGGHEWEEVVVSDATFARAHLDWEVRLGGRKSGSRFNPEWEPAYAPAPFGSGLAGQVAARIAAGTIVVIRKMQRNDGKPFWLAMSNTASRWPALIQGYTAFPPLNGKVYRWRYAWQEAEVQNQQWVVRQNGLYGQSGVDAGLGLALNGAERDGIIGAGGSGSSSSQESNAPIAVGIVVEMSMVGGVPWFSLGNTLNVTCGAP